MKKFIYPCIPFVLVIFFITVLGACNSAVSNNTAGFDSSWMSEVVKWEYEGHTYLIIKSRESGYGTSFYYISGITHDENCKCKK